MCCRFWRVLHPLLTLAAVACCAWLVWRDQHRSHLERISSGRLSARADFPVRHFLGLRWLGGDYELPADVAHCAATVLKFEDGKFLGRSRGGSVFSPKPGESRIVPYYVMWGRTPEGTRVVQGWPNGWSSSADAFFAKLDGGSSQSYGSASSDEFRGYHVIGYAASAQSRAGRESYANQFGGLDFVIENRQSVAVLALKTFPTEQEAQDWLLNSNELPDP